MRTPTYLSYSAMAMFEKDPDEFYLKYLAEHRPARLPQTGPMCVGSAFDAYVKSALHGALFGPSNNPVYEFGALFEEQVEPANRDFALGAGKHCFKAYKLTGAYDELLALLQQAIAPPRFECKLTGTIAGAPFLGKPDCEFKIKLNEVIDIVLDWKVKSFCSKWAASPTPGFMMCRDGWVGKASRGAGKPHKLYMDYDHHGLTINRGHMEDHQEEYADQCSLYGWLLGIPVDSEPVVQIDELVCKPQGDVVKKEYPLIRVANHRARVRKEYQQQLQNRVKTCWDAITSGHVFLEMTPEENEAHKAELDYMAIGLVSDGSTEEDWYSEVTRPQYKR